MDSTKPRTPCAYNLRPKKPEPPTPVSRLPKPKTRKPPQKVGNTSKPKSSTSFPRMVCQGRSPSSFKKTNGSPQSKASTSCPRVIRCPRPGGLGGVMMQTRPPPPTNVFCAVCLDTEDHATATRQLFCGHNFHVKCVESWLKKNYSCPVCRSPPDAMTDAYMARFQMFAQNMRQWFSQRPRYSNGGWSLR